MNPATAIAQAVRPAGKPLNNNDSAEGVVADCHKITGGLALGMEAEMIFGVVMQRRIIIRPYDRVLSHLYVFMSCAKKHCSGQPDGVAAENDDGQWVVGANDYSPLRNKCDSCRRAGTPKSKTKKQHVFPHNAF